MLHSGWHNQEPTHRLHSTCAIMLTAINKQFCYTKYFHPLLPSRLKHDPSVIPLYTQKKIKWAIHEKDILSFVVNSLTIVNNTSIQITASNTKQFISRTISGYLVIFFSSWLILLLQDHTGRVL